MPLLAAFNPNAEKRVTWLELFFDLIFALALAMSAKPLEHIGDFSKGSYLALGEFVLIFIFLIMFWYKHMVLMNRFDHSSFLFIIITLFIGFLVVAFTEFLRIWKIQPQLGSFLATITIFLAYICISGLYFLSSLNKAAEKSGERTWARVSSKHMLFESIAFLLALLVTPNLRPYWFIVVFLYFNRGPFETYFNPQKKSTLHPALVNKPPENASHKSERIGLFALLIYGLILILAATPLLNISSAESVEGILDPLLIFGTIFLFIAVIWFIHFKQIELTRPKTRQYTVITFVHLGLLVVSVHFVRIMLEHPSDFTASVFSFVTGLLFTIMAVSYWNVKTMAGLPPTDKMLNAFKQWAYILYTSAGAFFASIIFGSPVREIIWKAVFGFILIVMFFDRRLYLYYTQSQAAKKVIKFMDNQTSLGLTFIVLGIITFFVLTALMGKAIGSAWTIIWLAPIIIGIFIFLNHWLHTRIKPN
ncbi:MAG: low temperature requirement protein A [Nanoarchaeota archaeon]|nr:low temperature requirement protein A [Nanoarchaeota archaeon]MBU1704070.1 low temperature requirement protein A [Nanoarchaeota archaeon]